jgi:hypothetical protein
MNITNSLGITLTRDDLYGEKFKASSKYVLEDLIKMTDIVLLIYEKTEYHEDNCFT